MAKKVCNPPPKVSKAAKVLGSDNSSKQAKSEAARTLNEHKNKNH